MPRGQALLNTEVSRPAVLNCVHCGAVVPHSIDSLFCCRGCERVHALLEERHLTDYYRFSNSRNKKPVQWTDDDFSYLDEPHLNAGYLRGDGRQMHFYLEGVHCAACIWLTEKIPQFLSDASHVKLNLSSSIASVDRSDSGSFAAIAREFARLGYTPHAVASDGSQIEQKKENRKNLTKIGVAAASAGNIMLLAIAGYAGATGPLSDTFRWASFLLFLPTILYSATPFYRSAWSALRRFSISIDVPITFGLILGSAVSLGSLLTGSKHVYFDSVSSLIFLLLSTRYLLRGINQKSLGSTQLLAHVVPLKHLSIGEVCIVGAGETFPADGFLVDGESEASCSVLTGESQPQKIKTGSSVFAGTQNLTYPVSIQVTAIGSNTRVAKILSLVEDGLYHKTSIVTLMDQVGKIFSVGVILLSAVGFIVGLRLGIHEAVNRALAVAIVVCPCTFALATPLAMGLAISRCAKQGIWIRGADILERLSQIKTVWFDKTGTLTQGRQDQLRPDAVAAVTGIRGLGCTIQILSGDRPDKVKKIALELGIPDHHTHSNSTPEIKGQLVQSTPFGLMVGDGVNDTVALASASVGIAVAGGMEVSLRAAGVHLSQAGVMPIYRLLVIAKETLYVIRRNLAFAIIYNVIGIGVALTGHLDPLFAALLMPASALTVLLSTLVGTEKLRA